MADDSPEAKLLEDHWGENDGEMYDRYTRRSRWRLGRGVAYIVAHIAILTLYILITWYLMSKTYKTSITLDEAEPLTYSKRS